ncbi:MAG: NAD+ synthase [Spirochaetia bacterium]|jgi:NAD+ synthetase|nr:NAD+ synthase [Spirochaetia bacterium]
MKIAMAQINPTVADIEGNRKKILENINAASAAGADIVVFPEMATIGYPPMDLLHSRKLIDDNLRSLELIARASVDVAVICGFVDYDTENHPMLFNSAAFMFNGQIVSKHRKTLLPQYDVFDEMRYFSPARGHRIVDFMNHKIGITICEDIWKAAEAGAMMEFASYKKDPVKILKGMDADIIVNISASPFVKGKNRTRVNMLQKAAGADKIAIVYVNQAGGNDSLIFDGNSVLVNSAGAVAACGGAFAESLIIADSESSSVIKVEYDEIEDIRRALVLGIRDYASKCGFSSCLLGLSGGIDSSLTCVLACEALGRENVLGITMPSIYSSKGSVDDSAALAENLGITLESIPISGIFHGFEKELAPIFRGMEPDVTEENLQARIRGTLLMSVSNKTGRLLLTTGNKSETAMGYCTLYGDMNGGLAVISDLPKTLVYELARHINRDGIVIPAETIEKPPSAELRENQKDEDSLPPYSVLDPILEHYIEERRSVSEIISLGFDAETVTRVAQAVNRSEYKRRQAAPGLKVTAKAFGNGRRVPLAQKYEG